MSVKGINEIQGRPAYHLSMDIRTAGMTRALHPYHDQTDSWLDQSSLTTLRYVKRVRDSRYEDEESVDFDPACGRFKSHDKRIDKGTTEDHYGEIPANALDTYGALFYLRTLPLAVGGHYDIELFISGKSYAVTAVVRKKQRISVGAGKFECFLVEPLLRDASSPGKIKQIQWWFTTDVKHIPVRIRMEIAIGHIVAELTRLTETGKQQPAEGKPAD